MPADPYLEDAQLAAELAQRAGELLLQVRQQPGSEPTTLGKIGDQVSNDFLLSELAKRRPEDAVLSEESADDPKRLSAKRVWIIDPLDGTREYSEHGRTDWAVHVALSVGNTPVAGAVALPARKIVLRSDIPPKRAKEPVKRPRVLVSRSRPPKEAQAVADALGGELVSLGSAGAKTAAVILGEAEVYVHSGGQYEWDSAAPVVVAQAAGLYVSRLDGTPLRYNQANPYLPDLLICARSLAQRVLAVLGH